MKKILNCCIIIFFCFFYILDVKAFEINGEEYKIEIISDYFEREVYSDGFRVISKINKETSDLKNGKLDVSITFDNYLENEIIYVIDNISDFHFKTSQLNNLKTSIVKLYNKDYIKQGVVVTTKNNEYATIDFEHIESKLDDIYSIEEGNPGDVFRAMEYASTLFTSNTDSVKSIVLIVNSLGNEKIETLKKEVNKIVSSGINLFVLKTNSNINTEEYQEVFANANYKCLNSSNKNYCEINSSYIGYAIYPCDKTFGGFNVYFNDDTKDSFNVSIYDGDDINGWYDDNNNMIRFNFFAGMDGYGISVGKKTDMLSYSFSLSDDFDTNLIGEKIYTSKNIVGMFSSSGSCSYKSNNKGTVTYGGASYDDEVFEIRDGLSFRIVLARNSEEVSEENSPEISEKNPTEISGENPTENLEVVDENIENPQTGIEDIAIIDIFVLIVLFLLVIFIKFRSKDKIKRI